MNIFLTIDYELFLGERSGTVENCLLNPMDLLCKEIDKYGVKLTVFVDAAYLLRLFELKEIYPSLKKDYECVSRHIKSLAQDDHDIQMHFHPQWMYSSYDNLEWKIDMTHYKLSDMEFDFMNVSFSKAKSLLEKIVNKKIHAFRAGGYSIQSLPDYSNFFIRNEIAIDSSVSRYSKIKSDKHYFDYSNIPNEIIYNFSDDICKKEDTGKIKEVSITALKMSGIEYLLYRIINKYKYKNNTKIGDGYGMSKKRNIRNLITTKPICASLDCVLSPYLFKIFNNRLKNTERNFVAIGHPKSFSFDSISIISRFVKKNIKDHKFLTFADIDIS